MANPIHRTNIVAKDKRSQRKVADSTTELAKTALLVPSFSLDLSGSGVVAGRDGVRAGHPGRPDPGRPGTRRPWPARPAPPAEPLPQPSHPAVRTPACPTPRLTPYLGRLLGSPGASRVGRAGRAPRDVGRQRSIEVTPQSNGSQEKFWQKK